MGQPKTLLEIFLPFVLLMILTTIGIFYIRIDKRHKSKIREYYKIIIPWTVISQTIVSFIPKQYSFFGDIIVDGEIMLSGPHPELIESATRIINMASITNSFNMIIASIMIISGIIMIINIKRKN